ncbi:MAG TPA: hypothetical protein VF221_19100 [Chloroflexota bacterium]
MSKRTVMALSTGGLLVSATVAAAVVYSLESGVAAVAIPICMLVLCPALAAIALVATCSMVAPPVAGSLSVPLDEAGE